MAQVSGRVWGWSPGILTLTDLVREHRPAIEYDWRSRFGIAYDPPHTTSWGEAFRLVQVLAADPTSHLGAAIAGMPHPITREWAMLADLFDLTAQAVPRKRGAPRPKRYPRPWERRRFGRTHHDQQTVRSALRAMGHDT